MTMTYLDVGIYFASGVLVWVGLWLLFYKVKCRVNCPRPVSLRDRQMAAIAEMRMSEARRDYHRELCLYRMIRNSTATPRTQPQPQHVGVFDGISFCNVVIPPPPMSFPAEPPSYDDCIKMDMDFYRMRAEAEAAIAEQIQASAPEVAITIDAAVATTADTTTTAE